MIRVGTLVQIKAEAVAVGYNANVAFNRELTDEHGWLWIVEETPYSTRDQDGLYDCRSIATGEVAAWFGREITEKEQSNG